MTKGVMPRALVLAALPFVSLAAQQPAQRTGPSGRAAVRCNGQRIDQVLVYSDAPSVANLRRVPVVAELARTLHATTRPELLRRFLLLEPGDACVELRRAESERILRAQPYIADADLFVTANDSGGVDLEVHTSDEGSVVFGAGVRAKGSLLTWLLLGNANLGGQGVYASGAWRDGDGFRDGISGRIVDNQFLGNLWVATLEGERASLGGSWRAEVMHPYYTDLQRVAWRGQTGTSLNYPEIRLPDGRHPAVSIGRSYFDVGGLARVGPPGLLSLFGLSLTELEETPGARLIVGDSGVVRDVGALPGTYSAHRATRANFLFGVRDIAFVQRTGLDALTATQDVPVGVQVGMLAGHTIHSIGSRDDDVFVSGDIYAGMATQMGVLRFQARGEGRRADSTSVWDGILTSARLTHHLQFSPRHLNLVVLEWSGAYRQRIPFQLLLGIPEGGVRGYENSSLAGGQRVVARVEERFGIGRPFNLVDGGIALFADAGRQWAGDVPFGTTTPVKASLGLSLLAAIPPRSARLWRADLGFPITSGAGSRWTLTFTNADKARFVFREPRDVSDAREPTVPSSLYSWP